MYRLIPSAISIIFLLFSIPIWANYKTQLATDVQWQLAMDEPQKKGCCSRHGGVCGCDKKTGKAICCDGTLSPTCK